MTTQDKPRTRSSGYELACSICEEVFNIAQVNIDPATFAKNQEHRAVRDSMGLPRLSCKPSDCRLFSPGAEGFKNPYAGRSSQTYAKF